MGARARRHLDRHAVGAGGFGELEVAEEQHRAQHVHHLPLLPGLDSERREGPQHRLEVRGVVQPGDLSWDVGTRHY